MYQEVHEVYFTSGIIKVMKIESRNKWKKKKKKTDSVKLDTSIYLRHNEGFSTQARYLSIYEALQFQNSQIWISAHDDLDC